MRSWLYGQNRLDLFRNRFNHCAIEVFLLNYISILLLIASTANNQIMNLYGIESSKNKLEKCDEAQFVSYDFLFLPRFMVVLFLKRGLDLFIHTDYLISLFQVNWISRLHTSLKQNFYFFLFIQRNIFSLKLFNDYLSNNY